MEPAVLIAIRRLSPRVPIADARLLEHRAAVNLLSGPCMLALDSEREIEIQNPNTQIAVHLDPRGPWVIDVDAALVTGAAGGAFVMPHWHQANQVGP